MPQESLYSSWCAHFYSSLTLFFYTVTFYSVNLPYILGQFTYHKNSQKYIRDRQYIFVFILCISIISVSCLWYFHCIYISLLINNISLNMFFPINVFSLNSTLKSNYLLKLKGQRTNYYSLSLIGIWGPGWLSELGSWIT